MDEADLPAVLAIERALFPEDAWTEQMMRGELDAVPDTRHYLVAEVTTDDGNVYVAGYAGLMAAGGAADVQTIAVLPGDQGQGLGSALLGGLLDEAARRRCTEVFLEVRADNGRARRLYEWFGFGLVGSRPGYYQPSNTDALVMRLEHPEQHRRLADRG